MHFTAIPEILGQSNRGPLFTAGHLIFTAVLAEGSRMQTGENTRCRKSIILLGTLKLKKTNHNMPH